MTKKRTTIDTILKTWGEHNRALPDSERMKGEVFAKLVSTPQSPMLRRGLPWLSFGFAALAIVLFVVSHARPVATPYLVTNNVTSEAPPSSPEVPSDSKAGFPTGYFPGQPETPISDNREFLKTGYSATIRTRHVEDLTRRVELAVRGLGGRVDGSNSSREWGYITFAVPANRFEDFRSEIKSLVGDRFFEENISQQNLLPQKRSMEDEQKQFVSELNTARANRDNAVSAHAKTVASLQANLASVRSQLAMLRAEQTADPGRRTAIDAEIQDLSTKENSFQASLSTENVTYNRQLQGLDAQIAAATANINRVNNENSNFMDSLATVQGTISLSRISVWEIIQLYIPVGWMILILIAAAVASYILHRRRARWVVEM